MDPGVFRGSNRAVSGRFFQNHFQMFFIFYKQQEFLGKVITRYGIQK